MNMSNQRVDVIILAVLARHELAAVKRIFDIQPEDKIEHYGEEMWIRKVKTQHSGTLAIGITFIGDQGNSAASAVTTKFLRDLKPRLALLTGTAAGIRGKVKLGDVLVGKTVINYEGARLTGEGRQPRFDRENIDPTLSGQVELFGENISKGSWIEYFEKAQQQLPMQDQPPIHRKPDSYFAFIASGEKLFADGSLDAMAQGHDERIRGGEKEGFGFATAAKNEHVPWLIIRGISDHGDAESKDGKEKDKYHSTAMNAAASYIKAFLKEGLVLKTLPEPPSMRSWQSPQWDPLPIKAALISTEDKSGIENLIHFLKENGVRLISTPGVHSFLRGTGIKVESTWEFTRTPKLFDFRATLHPYVLACIATSPDASERCSILEKMGMCPIGLVICNAKPVQPPTSDASSKELTEYLAQMNVGVPLLLRWGIRQIFTTATVVSPTDYEVVIADLQKHHMQISGGLRKHLFRRALNYVNEHDRYLVNTYERLWPKDDL